MHFFKVASISSLAARVSSRHVHLHHRDAPLYGPSGTCPAVGTTTFEIQPVYYSSFIPTNTVFDPFHNGNLVTVTNAPTVLVMVAYITTIITPSSTVVRPPQGQSTVPADETEGSGGSSNTSSMRRSSDITSFIHPTASNPQSPSVVSRPTLSESEGDPLPASSVVTGPPPPASHPPTTLRPTSSPVNGAELTSASSDGLGSANGSNPATSSVGDISSTLSGVQGTGNTVSATTPAQGSPAISTAPPPETSSVAPYVSSLPYDSATMQDTSTGSRSSRSAVSQTPLTIGAGISKGVITSLPSSSPILLAFNDLRIQRVGIGRRQDDQDTAAGALTTQTTATLISVVNLGTAASAAPSGSTSFEGVSQDNCDDATPFILSEGLLLNGGSAVGKYRGTTAAVLGSLGGDGPPDQVNSTFTLDDGFLQWSTDDVGDASFFSCQGTLWAGFPNVPDSACSRVDVGAIAAEACASRVEETGNVNPSILAPETAVAFSSTSTSDPQTDSSSTTLSPSATLLSATGISSGSLSTAIGQFSVATSSATALVSSDGRDGTSTTTNLPSGDSIVSSSAIGTSSLITTPFLGAPASTLSTTTASASPRIPQTSGLPVYQGCNQDNCLRNLADTRYYTSAGPFCSSYTVSSAYPTPTWLDACNANPSRISSACSCLLPQSTQASSSSYITSSVTFSMTISGTQGTGTTNGGSFGSPLDLTFSSSTTNVGGSQYTSTTVLNAPPSRSTPTASSSRSSAPSSDFFVSTSTVSGRGEPTSVSLEGPSSSPSSSTEATSISLLSQSSLVFSSSNTGAAIGSSSSPSSSPSFSSDLAFTTSPGPSQSSLSPFADSDGPSSTENSSQSSTGGFSSSGTSSIVVSSTLTSPSSAPPSTTSSTSSSVFTSASPTATGQLCTGQDIGISGGSTAGNYNYQVVERDLTYSFSYEIECYALLTATPMGSLQLNIYSFEDCIDACSQINQDSGSGSCQGVSYNATVDACLLHNAIMGTDYPFYAGPNVYSARLIYAYYPVINDAFYLQYSPASANLGLCVNNAFYHDVISPQWVDTFDNSYENYCGQYFGGSNPVDPAYVAAYAAQLPGNISPGGIQDSESCLKVCDYANHYQPYQCAMYSFDTTYRLCSLYGSTDGQLITNPTVNAGRLLKSAVGYARPTDRTSATTYSTPYQYASPTIASPSVGTSSASTSSVSVSSGGLFTLPGTSTATTANDGVGYTSAPSSSSTIANNLVDAASATSVGQTSAADVVFSPVPNSPGGSSTSFDALVVSTLSSSFASSTRSPNFDVGSSAPLQSFSSSPGGGADSSSVLSTILIGNILSALTLPTTTLSGLSPPNLMSSLSLSMPSVNVPGGSVAFSSYSISLSLSMPAPDMSLGAGALSTLSSLTLPTSSIPNILNSLSSLTTLAMPTPGIPNILDSLSSLPTLAMPTPSIPNILNSLSSLPSLAMPTPSIPNILNPLSSLPSLAIPTPSIPNILDLSTLSSLTIPAPSVNPSGITIPNLPAVPTTSLSLSLSLTPMVLPTTSIAFPSANVPLQNLPVCPAANLLPLNPLSVSDSQGNSYLATVNIAQVTVTICTVVSVTPSQAPSIPSSPAGYQGGITTTLPNAVATTTPPGASITQCSSIPPGGILNVNGQYYLTLDLQQGVYVTVCATALVGGVVTTPAITTQSGIGYGLSSSSLSVLPAVTSLPACAPGTQGNAGLLGQFYTVLDPLLQAYVTLCVVVGANAGVSVGIDSSGIGVSIGASLGLSDTLGASINVNVPSVNVGAAGNVNVGVGTTGINVGAGGNIGVGIGSTTILNVGAGVGIGVNSGGATVTVNLLNLPCIGLGCGSGGGAATTSSGIAYGGGSIVSTTSRANAAGGQATTSYTTTTRSSTTTRRTSSPYVSNVCLLGLPCTLLTLYI